MNTLLAHLGGVHVHPEDVVIIAPVLIACAVAARWLRKGGSR